MLASFVALTLAQRDAGAVYMPPKACLTDVLSNFVRLDADADLVDEDWDDLDPKEKLESGDDE